MKQKKLTALAIEIRPKKISARKLGQHQKKVDVWVASFLKLLLGQAP